MINIRKKAVKSQTAGGILGVTLVELIVSITIVSIIAAASAAVLRTGLYVQAHVKTLNDLNPEAWWLMSRITQRVKGTSHVFIPNGAAPNRNFMVLSANINQDNDNYFGDSMFPRFDEDPSADMDNNTKSGIANVDDNNDGHTDGLNAANDDEDYTGSISLIGGILTFLLGGGEKLNEDALDGVDNDADNSIDEDYGTDSDGKGYPGLRGINDDGDASVDEGVAGDDDEDGSQSEDWLDPLIFRFDSPNKELEEQSITGGTNVVLSNRVTAFSVVYEAADASHVPRLLITLTLTESGQIVTLSEYVYPRNLQQNTGKKVR